MGWSVAPPALVALFALLHDSRRRGDGPDPAHGRAAAAPARHLHAEGLLDLQPGRL